MVDFSYNRKHYYFSNSFSFRYRAELEPHPQMDKCFISKLSVTNVGQGDSRQYVVRAENDRGMDMVTIQLLVQGADK